MVSIKFRVQMLYAYEASLTIYASMAWSFTHAGIFGRKEIAEFSATHMNRPCRLLQKSKKTLHKEKGLLRE